MKAKIEMSENNGILFSQINTEGNFLDAWRAKDISSTAFSCT